MQRRERSAGLRGVEPLGIVVNVLPKADDEAVALVRPGRELSRRRDNGCPGPGEERRERNNLLFPPTTTQTPERDWHPRDDRSGIEVHDDVREVAEHDRLAAADAEIRSGSDGSENGRRLHGEVLPFSAPERCVLTDQDGRSLERTPG